MTDKARRGIPYTKWVIMGRMLSKSKSRRRQIPKNDAMMARKASAIIMGTLGKYVCMKFFCFMGTSPVISMYFLHFSIFLGITQLFNKTNE